MKTAQDLFIEGKKYHGENPEKALDLYEQALKLDSNNADIYNAKAAALQNLNRIPEAIASFDKAITLDPKHVKALCNKGKLLSSQGELDGAIICFDIAINANPEDYLGYHSKALALMDNNRREEDIIKLFDTAISKSKGDDYVYILTDKACYLQDKGKIDEAIKCFDQILSVIPDDDQAQKDLGICYHKKKEYAKAIKIFDNTNKDGKNYGALYLKGLSLKEDKKLPEALDCFNEAIRINKDYVKAYLEKANVLSALKRYADVVQTFDEVINMQPKDAQAYYGKGLALYKLKDKKEALRCYEKATELDPNFANAYNSQGNVLVDFGNEDEALIRYTKAIEKNKNCAVYYCSRAKIYDKMHESEKSFSDFAEASRLAEKGEFAGLSEDNIKYIKDTLADFTKSQKSINELEKKLGSVAGSKEDKEETDKALTEFKNQVNTTLAQATTDKLNNFDKKEKAKEKNKGDKIKELEEENEETANKMRALQELMDNMMKMQAKDQKELMEKIAQKKKELDKLSQRVEVVVCKVAEIKKRLNKLADDFKMSKKEFEEKFKLNDEKINKLKKDVETGVQNINSAFAKDIQLKEYALKFYFTLNDYIQAYKISATGISKDNDKSKVQKFFGFLSSVSVTGCLSDVIEKVVELNGDIPFENRAKAITDIARYAESTINKELTKIIGATAIVVTKVRRKEIKEASEDKITSLDDAEKKVKEKLESFVNSIAKSDGEKGKIYNSKIEEMAVQDVGSFLNFLMRIKANEAITKNTFSIAVFNDKNGDLVRKAKAEKFDRGGCCACILMPSRVIYENEKMNKANYILTVISNTVMKSFQSKG